MAHFRSRWPDVSLDDAHEGVQQALLNALESDPRLNGDRLLAAAKLALQKLGRDAYWQKRREFTVDSAKGIDKVAGTDELGKPISLYRERPSRRVGARRPKGVASYQTRDTGFQLLEREVGDVPSNELKLAAHILRRGRLREIEAGEPTDEKTAKRVLKLYRDLQGHGPADSWATVLIEQVARARLKALEPVEAKRTPADLSQAGITIEGTDLRAPGKSKRSIQARAKVVSRRGNRAVIGFYGNIGEGERLLATTVTHYTGPATQYPTNARDRACFVLARTIKKLATYPVPCPIPAYACDLEVVAWLELRMGFQGAGGQDSMTKATLLQLLLDPEKLANEIERHGKRKAARVSEELSKVLETRTAELVARVRQGGRVSPDEKSPSSGE